jgi:hypothetical protein
MGKSVINNFMVLYAILDDLFMSFELSFEILPKLVLMIDMMLNCILGF